MKRTKWITGGFDDKIAEGLSEALALPSLAAKFLVARGITAEAEARAFLDKDIGGLHDPFLMRDMDKAVSRIERALKSGEKIAVYGDYDADGITATYIMLHYLKSVGADCTYHIPDRLSDGYGVAEEALRELAAEGVGLVITVDTGITAVEEAETAKSLGIDMIITDHHKCGASIPDVCAVVNPNRDDCNYPFSGLAGVGVAFKLISALCGGSEEVADRYLPYACIGTVADVMPLIDENRIIMSLGLAKIPDKKNIGISALLTEAGSTKRELLSAGAVGFLIGPRINAAGRMGDASLALRLLFADSEAEATELSAKLGDKNRERQRCEGEIMEEAFALLEEHPEYEEKNALVLDGEGWHQGVLGIVASRICARFGKPAVLISRDGGECRGSGRSVPGVSIFGALEKCRDVLVGFGGHDLAAGIVIRSGDIQRFRERLSDALSDEMREYVPTLEIDFAVSPEELTVSQLEALQVMAPFGKGNEAPLLRLDNCKVSRIMAIGGGRHLKIVIEHGAVFECVYFGKTREEIPFSEGDYVDIAFTPEINNYNGKSVQLHIKDARLCESDYEEISGALEALDRLRRGDASNIMLVEYRELGIIWRAITRADFELDAPISAMTKKLWGIDRGLTVHKLLSALEICKEVGLLDFSCDGFRVHISIAEHNNKVDLNDSATYVALQRL